VLRATVSGDGRLGPIEERLGRRLIRLVDPSSEEGRSLLARHAVDLLGPGGERYGCVDLEEARRKLRARIEAHLSKTSSRSNDADALREGLRRLDSGEPDH
jgi:hypothetical protein